MAAGVFSARGPRYFSIPSGRPFLDDLAIGLTASAAAAGFSLPDATIYLPTRRAARALGEAFLNASGATATLTPHIRALGDIDEDELELAETDIGASLEDELALAPPIPSAERRLVLARFIAEKDKTWFDGQRHWAGAIAAADELGRLLDSLYTEEISPAALDGLAPEELAAHWRESLEFLSIVTKQWPAFLKSQGLCDPAARRIALIDLQTQRWRETPPQKPVIIAGTTGSTPAVARMMKVVASLPHGCVVLPGLDLDAPPHVWDAVDEPHPQSGLKALLAALEAPRDSVCPWPASENAAPQQRAALVSIALRPADASDDWRAWAEAAKSEPAIAGALDGLSLVEARDEEREASVIALKFRETVEAPGRTAMLVTPDRDLARRVAMKMRRWGVAVDDSAGAPFANTRCGIFLRLVAAWLGDVADPVRLAALIDHPLFGGGLDAQPRARAAVRIDRGLRGLAPPPGMDGVRRKLTATKALNEDVERLLGALEQAAAGWPGADAPFTDRFEAHLRAAEILCATPDEPGPARLWRDDDGETGATLLAQLRGGLGFIVHDRAEEYADIFTRLIAGGAVRRSAPAHPRLYILGPIEARLQTADIVILAGLNEGLWPRDAAVDPFLSRGMRRRLGLPSPERRIGLAAHDFAQMTAGAEVMLTRSARAAGKPTKPSRWIVRLKNILKGAELLKHIDATAEMEARAGMLDRPEKAARIEAPRPQPPADARPGSFSVTQIEKLLRDPYAIYARRILRLKKLDPLGEAFDARHLGNLFHQVLEDYARDAPPADRPARIARLEALFDAHAAAHGYGAENDPFWRARAREAFAFLADWDAERRRAGAPAVTEGVGAWAFPLDGRDYELHARADRIDRLNDGGAFIADYKTGKPPSLRQSSTFSPQLPLTGLIVAAGGFAALGPAPVSGFEYVHVIGRKRDEKPVGATGADARDIMDAARDGLFALFRHFADPASPYPSQPRPQYADDYGDYDHLARRKERNAQGGGDDGDFGGGGDA